MGQTSEDICNPILFTMNPQSIVTSPRSLIWNPKRKEEEKKNLP
jgi:hypothetical protein